MQINFKDYNPFSGVTRLVTLINKKDGYEAKSSLSTGEDDYIRKDDLLRLLIIQCINMDEWKHSWHEKIDRKNKKRLKEIIDEKIRNRKEEIEKLKAGRTFLKWL